MQRMVIFCSCYWIMQRMMFHGPVTSLDNPNIIVFGSYVRMRDSYNFPVKKVKKNKMA